jgi:hypothetical protein
MTMVRNRFRIPKFLEHLTVDDLNHHDNLFPSCASCNHYKGSWDLEGFRGQLGMIVGRLNERVVIYKLAKKHGLLEETKKPVVFYFETI